MVISQTAHYLASIPEIKKVVVLTPNNLLQNQIVDKFFSKSHPLHLQGKIDHVVATGGELIKLVFGMTAEDLKSTVILIDEVDSFILGDRLRAYHIGDFSQTSKSDDESTYIVDLLDLIFRYKFVIGFCAHVDESINRILIAK